MENFIATISLDELASGRGTSVKVGDKSVALFNVDGAVYAIDNNCPHAGGSLGASKLNGTIVTCQGHGMKFDVRNGFFGGTSSFGVASYPVKIVERKIYVSVGSRDKAG